jgi:hypothetical protein
VSTDFENGRYLARIIAGSNFEFANLYETPETDRISMLILQNAKLQFLAAGVEPLTIRESGPSLPRLKKLPVATELNSHSIADAKAFHCPLLNGACIADACALWLWRGRRPGDPVTDAVDFAPGTVRERTHEAQPDECRGLCGLARTD